MSVLSQPFKTSDGQFFFSDISKVHRSREWLGIYKVNLVCKVMEKKTPLISEDSLLPA